MRYCVLQQVYDHFNAGPFSDELRNVVITLQRQADSYGHFSPHRFSSRSYENREDRGRGRVVRHGPGIVREAVAALADATTALARIAAPRCNGFWEGARDETRPKPSSALSGAYRRHRVEAPGRRRHPGAAASCELTISRSTPCESTRSVVAVIRTSWRSNASSERISSHHEANMKDPPRCQTYRTFTVRPIGPSRYLSHFAPLECGERVPRDLDLQFGDRRA
jgi:hypothetical protein